MTTADTSVPQTAAAPIGAAWISRIRFVLAVAFVWACLHFVVDRTLLARGFERPVVLTAAPEGLVNGIAAGVVLLVASLIAGALAGMPSGAGGLLALGLGLAFWAAGGGTMDHWLRFCHPVPGPSTAGPFAALLPDYLMLAIITAIVAGVSGYSGRSQATRENRLRSAFALDASPEELRNGVLALLTGIAVTGVLLFILAGPPEGQTRRGQVMFGVAVACSVSVLVVRSVSPVRRAIWYWPVPILVGVIGLLLSCAKPELQAPLSDLDTQPPWWGLARPLPVEMVGVGLFVTVWLISVNKRGVRDT